MRGYKINSDANTEKPMRAVQFFNLYFGNFHIILLSNLLFLPFNLLAIGYAALMYKLLGGLNIAATAAAVIILNVGMSGVALVCRYIYTRKEFKVFSAFVKGVKENALSFLIHGVVFYIAFAVSYFSAILYYNGTKSSAVFWLPLIITAVIALAFLFASYYMNVMTVTMDIPRRSLYRNCALFSFGELKNNLLATAAMLIFGALIFTICYIINDMWVVLLILAIFQIFIIPSTVQYMITFYVYDDMVGILDETQRRKKADDDGETQTEEKAPSIDKSEAEDISNMVPESKDEYIFYNGRMIKRSEVEKMLSGDEE